MRHLLAAAIALIAVPTIASAADSKIIGVAPFTGVDISSGIHAVVVSGEHALVARSPRDNGLADLRYDVRNGVFRAWVDWDMWHLLDLSDRDITIEISTPALDRLEASSGADIVANNILGDVLAIEVSSGAHVVAHTTAVRAFTLEASSGASLELDGACTTANAEVSSGAAIMAGDLGCADINLEGSSGGHIEIGASKTLAAEGSSGAGFVIYGKPSVTNLDTDSGATVEFHDVRS